VTSRFPFPQARLSSYLPPPMRLAAPRFACRVMAGGQELTRTGAQLVGAGDWTNIQAARLGTIDAEKSIASAGDDTKHCDPDCRPGWASSQRDQLLGLQRTHGPDWRRATLRLDLRRDMQPALPPSPGLPGHSVTSTARAREQSWNHSLPCGIHHCYATTQLCVLQVPAGGTRP
jgi:hypothetical protein